METFTVLIGVVVTQVFVSITIYPAVPLKCMHFLIKVTGGEGGTFGYSVSWALLWHRFYVLVDWLISLWG